MKRTWNNVQELCKFNTKVLNSKMEVFAIQVAVISGVLHMEDSGQHPPACSCPCTSLFVVPSARP